MRCRFIFLLLLAFGFALNPTLAQQQDPPKPPDSEEEVISFETNLVVVNVTITDPKDRYVTGLKVEDFNILEDNSPQRILSFGFEETPFAAAILLDTSASMEKKLTLERSACANFVDGMRERDHFAIFSFGGARVKRLQDFTEVRDIPDSIWDLRAEGNTPLYDAIVKAADALAKRPERRRAILVVSDGADTQSKATLDLAMRRVVGAYISIYAVDLTDASVYGAPPRDNGAEGHKLREAFATTVNELRRQYTLTYESTNDREDGRWRAIEVRVARPKLNIRSRQGSYARRRKA
jgi:Ca-activated chloride channel family protein